MVHTRGTEQITRIEFLCTDAVSKASGFFLLGAQLTTLMCADNHYVKSWNVFGGASGILSVLVIQVCMFL